MTALNDSRLLLRAAFVLGVSWVLTTLLTSQFIARYWANAGDSALGVNRAIAGALMLLAVHLLGLALYRQQMRSSPNAATSSEVIELAPTPIEWQRAARTGALIDVTLLALTSLMLDGGRSARGCALLVLVHFLLVIGLRAFRQDRETRLELAFVRYGVLMFALLNASISLLSELARAR